MERWNSFELCSQTAKPLTSPWWRSWQLWLRRAPLLHRSAAQHTSPPWRIRTALWGKRSPSRLTAPRCKKTRRKRCTCHGPCPRNRRVAGRWMGICISGTCDREMCVKWKSVTTDDFLCLSLFWRRNKIGEVKVAGKQGMWLNKLVFGGRCEILRIVLDPKRCSVVLLMGCSDSTLQSFFCFPLSFVLFE